MINKPHLGWRLMGVLLLLLGLTLAGRMVYLAVFGFALVIIISAFLYGAYFCIQRRDIIK